MFDIIVIGSSTRDIFLKLPDGSVVNDSKSPTGKTISFPLGSKLEIHQIEITTGGGGTNAAVTFARQGLATACIGVVGQDANGRELVAELGKEGIDVSGFQEHGDGHTAYSVLLVDQGGERTILSYKGEGQHFDASKLTLDHMQAKWLYLDSLGGHYDILEKVVQWAVANNVKLATNPGGKELDHGLEKWRPLLKNFSIVMMNQEEAAKLSGIEYAKEVELFKFMDELIGGVFVMTKGPEGVMVSDGKQIYRASVPDSPVVERTGAGDAFNSAFVAEYSRSGDITKAIQLGTANASSVVTHYGAKAGILKHGDMGPWELVEVQVQNL